MDLFKKEICGGLKLSIFQYNVLHFQSTTLGGIFSLVKLRYPRLIKNGSLIFPYSPLKPHEKSRLESVLFIDNSTNL